MRPHCTLKLDVWGLTFANTLKYKKPVTDSKSAVRLWDAGTGVAGKQIM